MITHTIIKMHYIRYGYLPNYPYHLISDKEMFDAFINNEINYFDDNYPCEFESLRDVYTELKDAIKYHVDKHLDDPYESYVIPDWVYSYMLGVPVTFDSSDLDKHDLLVLLDMDNLYDEITEPVMKSIYGVSKRWISKLTPTKRDHRPPTIFGEPHVLKSLRLDSADISNT